jgi:hypothetical protein
MLHLLFPAHPSTQKMESYTARILVQFASKIVTIYFNGFLAAKPYGHADTES